MIKHIGFSGHEKMYPTTRGILKMEAQKNTKNIVRSVLSGIGITILSLLIGIVLDYGITQILSQYFIEGCSEDCYFQYFNSIFVIVAILSVGIGFLAGQRTYKKGKLT